MLSFAAEIFETIVKFRNTFYDRGWLKSIAADAPVVSIGNLSAGGSGKTPFVKLTCDLLKKYGLRPAIVGRGYKRASKGNIIVRDITGVRATAEEAGDEMLWLAERTGCATLAADSKSDGAVYAAGLFKPDAIVVDDGFQHRRLKRDLDVVLIAESDLKRPFLMPQGRLREPLYSVNRAHVIAIPEGVEEIYELPEFLQREALLVRFKREFGAFNFEPDNNFAFAGIARPERFFNMLRGAGVPVGETHGLADHFRFDPDSVNKIVQSVKKSRASRALTTEKDFVKLRRFLPLFEREGIALTAVPLEIKLTLGEEEYVERVVGAVRKRLPD
ncbi:MAG: tetraacyldisaccharide 4'-kinase [Chloroflexota bacterium]